MEADRLSRTFGFHRLGKVDVDHVTKNAVNPKTGEKQRHFIEAYASGINAYLNSDKYRTPVEFTLLRIQPKPWTEDEIGAIVRLLVWQMSRGWHYKITNLAVTKAIGKFPKSYNGANLTDTILESLFDLTESDSPTTLPTGDLEINWDVFDKLVDNSPPSEQGSNAWTVSGKFTKDGKPLLASDPHLLQSLPSVWYQNHLVVQKNGKTSLNVTGVSMPGCPFVLIGHNDNIAWGITLSYADIADIFLEKFSKDGKMYEFNGEMKSVEMIDEVIHVKGKDQPHVEKVRITHHGPILSGLVKYDKSPLEFAISATYLKDTLRVPMDVFLELNQAQNAKQVRQVLLKVGLLSVNIVYADSQGNIGYQMTGEVPIRTKKAIANANLPHAGWDGESEWQGYLDTKENPATVNPEQGYVISCNHRIVGPDYKHYLGSAFKFGARAIRVKTLLDETYKKNKVLTLEDFAKWQFDVTEAKDLWEPLVHMVKSNLGELEKIAPLKENVTHDHVVQCLREVSEFNGELDKDSVRAGIYVVYVDQLFKILMNRLGLEESLWQRVKGCGLNPALFSVNEYFGHEVHTIHKLTKIPELFVKKDLYTAMVETIKSLRTVLKLKQAHQDPHEVILNGGYLDRILNKERNITIEEEINLYKYGNFHQLPFNHAMGQLIPEFNRGPHPVGGSVNTPNMNAQYPDGKSYVVKMNASFRMLVNLGKTSEAVSIFAPGQSGNMASSHYNDFSDKFLHGEYNPMLFSGESIERNKESTLVLKQ